METSLKCLFLNRSDTMACDTGRDDQRVSDAVAQGDSFLADAVDYAVGDAAV